MRVILILFLCLSAFKVTIKAQSNLSFQVWGREASCESGYTDGEAFVSIFDGVPPYSYLWSNGSTTGRVYNLSPIKYDVTITDSQGATGVNSVVIEKYTNTYMNAEITKPSCSGTPGEIKLIDTNNIGNLTYQWDEVNKSTTSSISGLAEGTYTVTVTTQLGCSFVDSYTLKKGLTFLADVKEENCKEKGSIAIKDVKGGMPPYTYQWSNGAANTPTVVGLTGLMYYDVTVTDAMGCSQINSYSVNKSQISIYANVKTTDCQKNEGSIEVNAYSYNNNHTYKWNTGQTTPNIYNLSVGTYTLTITDDKGCSLLNSFLVEGNMNIQIDKNIPCGSNNGSLKATVLSGGTSPFQYVWSNGSNSNPIGIVTPGTYTLTIIDSQGCQSSTSVYTDSGNNLVGTISNSAYQYIIKKPDCPILDFTLNNGVSPYTYQWSNGVTTNSQDLFELNQGKYTVTVTDSQGCSGVFSKILYEWDYHPRILLKKSVCGNKVEFKPVCDKFTYSYLWSNGQTTNKVQNLSIGRYYVTITDAKHNSSAIDTTDITTNLPCVLLKGYVKLDDNKNCIADAQESNLSNKIVTILPGPLYATANQNGYYEIVVPQGDYTVNVSANTLLEKACPDSFPITVAGVTMLDLPLQVANCPFRTVDISTPFLRRCFDNTYNVFYCNKGTMTAQNTYIEIKLDKDLTYKSSTIPLTSQNGNILRFDVGNVLPNECKSFFLTLNLNCNGTTIGQTHCVEAHIYPDSLCLPAPPTYSGAKVITTATCNGNEVKLTLKNEGTAPMSSDKSYIIIEDQVIYKQGNFKLNPNEILEFKYPANGKTYRIEAEQENGYPLIPSMPSAWVEACGTNSQGGFSTGFVAQFGNNGAEPFLAIDCHQSIGSYDPNEKQAYPIGYDKQHYIAQNQSLEYILNFQNEGTDTAFTVVLLDTLSNLLDPRTLEMGASSHLFEWNLEGNGILKITFPKINLLTKKQNELASQGFVKFQIAQKKDLPLGSVIKNRAGIYFDFNDVILTNTVFHTLGKNFIRLTSLNDNEMPKFEVKLYPNPTSDKATFVLPHLENQTIKFNVFDLTGRVLYEREITDNVFKLDCSNIPNGMYLYQFSSNDAVLNKGKMSVVR